ncbi:MAG: TonB-dependent receptor plug domain-containing protein, partial [Bacteroidota bacterium]
MLARNACYKLIFFLVSINYVMAQKIVSGKVTDETGEALPGVNVIIQGTTTGVTTDLDGNFRLSVDENAVLVFSYVGFQSQEVAVGARSTIDISLGGATELQEVIVTAVGIERDKKALGYAVSEVTGDDLAQRAEPDAVRSLQGKIPGVNILSSGGASGSGTNINIRGQSSLLGNNQPLFVVDGIPFDNSTTASGQFNTAAGNGATSRSFDIDPNNIESMTVLKGAAASALYGSRASNGVIVITTKSGRSRNSRKGLEVSVTNAYNVIQIANLAEYQKTYTQGNNFLYVDGNFGTWGAPFDLENSAWDVDENRNLIRSIDPTTGLAWVNHPYDRYNNPQATPFFPEFSEDSVLLRPFDVPDSYLRNGYSLENSISVTSGGEKSNFSATLSRTFEEGFTPGNEVERISASVGGNVSLDNGLIVGGTFNFVNTNVVTPPVGGLFSGGISVYERLLFLPPNIDLRGLPIEDANGNSAFYRPDNDNPIYLSRNAPQESDVNRFFGKVNF